MDPASSATDSKENESMTKGDRWLTNVIAFDHSILLIVGAPDTLLSDSMIVPMYEITM